MKLAEMSFSSAAFQSREKVLGKKLAVMENFRPREELSIEECFTQSH